MNSCELWNETRKLRRKIDHNFRLVRSLLWLGIACTLVPVLFVVITFDRLTARHSHVTLAMLGVSILMLLYALGLALANNRAYKRLLNLREKRKQVIRDLGTHDAPDGER